MDIPRVNELVLTHPVLPSGQYQAGRGVADPERDYLLGMYGLEPGVQEKTW